VNKIEINYAKTAKKMDMKRLKNTMWNLLTDSLEKPAKVNLKYFNVSFPPGLIDCNFVWSANVFFFLNASSLQTWVQILFKIVQIL
jgi:hypothetical protein